MSIPESTTAIVGIVSDDACVVQSTAVPMVQAHFCAFIWGSCTELIFTASFGTIAETNEVLARNAI